MNSTCQELAPVIGLVSVEEFRKRGVVPTYFDSTSRRLKLICGTAIDDACRKELAERLPDIEIEWHLADEKVFEFMYQRIAGEFPEQAAPPKDMTPENGAPEDTADSNETEKPTDEGSPALAETDTPSSESGQVVDIEEPAPPLAGEVPGAEDLPDIPPGQNTELSESQEIDQPVTDKVPEPEHNSDIPPGQRTVLFVTPKGHIAQHLVFSLDAERLEAVTVSSFDRAVEELERRPIACIFIHENLHGNKNQFVRQVQRTNPDTPIRNYRSEASILLNETREQTVFDLIRQNLTLFSRLNDPQGSAVADHAALVAKFVDRMMARMEIPYHYRPLITTSAFLHNMAEENLKSTEGLTPTDIIGHSASRLESWNFPQQVVQLLRRMYKPMNEDEASPDGVEITGGYILTAADVFCHHWPDFANAGYQVDLVRTKMEEKLRGKVTPLVMDTLIDLIQDDSTAQTLSPDAFAVHIYTPGEPQPVDLTKALEEADFNVTFSSSIGDCVRICNGVGTQALIIRHTGSVQDIYDSLMSLALNGLALNQLQIVLLLEEHMVTEALRLLSHGVEDILPVTGPPQAVVTKLARIKSRIEEQYRHRKSLTERLGTHGSLGDMCLLDILEGFRGVRPPARISVTAYGNQLTVYLDSGKVVAADCGEYEGSAALLKGISWKQGVWNIESIQASDLPEPNIEQSIDTVLIEACTKLDEVVKDDPICELVSPLE